MSSATLTPTTLAMPRLSDSMQEATIATWLKQPGDAVARGEGLVEIETDKATMVYEAELDGVLGTLLAAAGETVALGAPIAELLVEGAPPAPVDGAAQDPLAAPARAAAGSAAAAPAPAGAAPPRGSRVRATPVARRVARELGVALDQVTPSGPRGRVVRADVLAAAARTGERAGTPSAPLPRPAPVGGAGDEVVELTATQRTIARHMVASRSEIPEFTLTAELDVTEALALRRRLADAGRRVSVNDLVVKACALVLREQPALNASWAGDHVVRHGGVHVGIAVAAEGALLVPVVRDADRLALPELAAAARAAGERARERTATPDELQGGTFTVTNLGMFGVLSFDAVIHAPQVAILAVGATTRRPAFDDAGAVVPRDLVYVSLSCDHRAVYGADAARFLARVRELLEDPVLLLLGPA